nr:hypothetical protein [Bradyrhizobium sp. 2S1]MCK7664918.1 hypothetical protein [Bradyrhizobium sp. 2S1]
MRRRDVLGLLGATLVSPTKVSFAQTLASGGDTKRLRIVVVANTYYEGDGLMTVLCNRWARNPKVGLPGDMAWPRAVADLKANPAVPVDPRPRCRITTLAQTGGATANVEIWCLDDLMDKAINHGASDKKQDAMAAIKSYAPAGGSIVPPDGVIAFGTAAFPDIVPYDGCATVGGGIYVRDAQMDGPGDHSSWTWEGIGRLIPSKTPASFFKNVLADPQTVLTINSQMLTVPVNPSSKPRLIIAADGVAVSSVNIPRDTPYSLVDQKTVIAAQQAGATNVTSVETTHGVIRAQWPLETPFIYVTAIPNRIGHFPDEAQANYSQEVASVHNAAIALNHIIPYFVAALGSA